MKALFILSVICIVYYFTHKQEWMELSLKNHIQFGIFTSVYLFLYYVLSYQKEFVYKVFKNVHQTDSQHYNPDISYQNDIVKYKLAEQQNHRCYGCQNPIFQKEIEKYKINYKVPLTKGGNHSFDNLAIYCRECNAFL